MVEGYAMGTSGFTAEERKILYEKYQCSRQEKLRLYVALEGMMHQEELEEDWRAAYQAYLFRRKRPALELLEKVEKDAFLWKTSLSREDIWGQVGLELARRYPHFASAFGGLTPMIGQKQEAGCDGLRLFYPEEWKREKELQWLCRCYVHMVLHCLFGHLLLGEGRDKELWNLSCDIAVEYFLWKEFPSLLGPSFSLQVRRMAFGEGMDKLQAEREKVFTALQKEVPSFHGESLYDYLLIKRKEEKDLSRETVEHWKTLFFVDSHSFWKRYEYPQSSRVSTGKGLEAFVKISKAREEMAQKWSRLRYQTDQVGGNMGVFRGNAPGGEIQKISLKKEKKYDYRQFLERFAVSGEELQLDLESFDYIPYTYSRSRYEKLVFLEPLEYAQVHKLKELVIAVDTSGSCRGEIVRRFLEETYQILSRQENFFKKMRVHLIQCDSMIQGYACIESQEQWMEVSGHLKVQGFGGTDFRPVFALIEELKEKKVIQDLQGLIYFTDGDGIYPRKAPEYETAFVFLNQTLEKGKVPAWAYKLNLELPESSVVRDKG